MNNLKIQESASYNLKKAAGWIKFLSILNYIGFGLIIFASLIMLIFTIVGIVNASKYGSGGAWWLIIIPVLYALLSLLLYFPAKFGSKFESKINRAIDADNQKCMDDAFMALGSYFKFYGVMAIVYLSFIGLYLIAALLMGFYFFSSVSPY